MNNLNRFSALLLAFNLQGNTIHNLLNDMGLDKNYDLFTSVADESSYEYIVGKNAGKACTMDHVRKTYFKFYHGNKQFWLGLADGIIEAGKVLQYGHYRK